MELGRYVWIEYLCTDKNDESVGHFVSILLLRVIMIIERNEYVDQLLAKRWNGKIKIITGLRRSGKSFLLSTLYKRRLMQEGVERDAFIEIALDRKSDMAYRNPNLLYDYVMARTKDSNRDYYIFIDEIQLS